MRSPGNRRGGKRRRSAESGGQKQPGLDLRLVGAIFLLFIFVPYFLKDALGVRFGTIGSYFWLVGLFLSFIAGAFYWSQFLLPIPWQLSWYEGFRLMIRYNFPFLVTVTRELRIRPNISGATTDAARDLPESFLRHKAGIIESHQTPVIFRGGSFVRGAGPGFLRLKQGERIVQVVDLRRHFRTLPVEALTRDGIKVKSGVSTIFYVKHQDDPPDENLPYPFEQDAIFKVNYLGNFKTDEDKIITWSDRVCRQAASALIGEVSRYSLDDLFQPDESTAAPLEHIKGKITKDLEKTFEKYGIEISLVTVAPFQVSKDIQDERFRIWQAEWERQIGVKHGTASAERDRRLKLARARAQIEMIEKLTEGLESVEATGQDMTEVLALRFIEALEQAETKAAVSAAYIPGQIANHLKTIRRQVLGEDE